MTLHKRTKIPLLRYFESGKNARFWSFGICHFAICHPRLCTSGHLGNYLCFFGFFDIPSHFAPYRLSHHSLIQTLLAHRLNTPSMERIWAAWVEYIAFVEFVALVQGFGLSAVDMLLWVVGLTVCL